MMKWVMRQQSKRGGKSTGFTIVELIIVIAVIAILATLGFVGYSTVVSNANDASLKEDLAKLSDVIKLEALDNQVNPIGGATSSNTGDSSSLAGVSFKPNTATYDQKVSNLYYCSGLIDGTNEFTVIAKGKSSKAFSFSSKGGLKEFPSYAWGVNNDGAAICGLAGYTAPFTWAYGFDATPGSGWMAWAFDGPILTNLVPNPSGETDNTGWKNYTGFGTPARVITTAWAGSASLSAVGLGTSSTPRFYIDFPASPGDVISATFRVRSDGQSATAGFLTPKAMSSGTEIATIATLSSAWSPDAYGWVKVTGTFTVPASSTAVRLAVGLTSSTNYTGTMGIDGVMAVKSATVPTYADGNTARWSWDGTTNNSSSTGPAL